MSITLDPALSLNHQKPTRVRVTIPYRLLTQFDPDLVLPKNQTVTPDPFYPQAERVALAIAQNLRTALFNLTDPVPKIDPDDFKHTVSFILSSAGSEGKSRCGAGELEDEWTEFTSSIQFDLEHGVDKRKGLNPVFVDILAELDAEGKVVFVPWVVKGCGRWLVNRQYDEMGFARYWLARPRDLRERRRGLIGVVWRLLWRRV